MAGAAAAAVDSDDVFAELFALLTKFSLSLSAYLLASWRSFSASVSELALSMSNRDRLLVLNELAGARMVAVGFVNSSDSVFLLRLFAAGVGTLKVAVVDTASSLLFSLAAEPIVAATLLSIPFGAAIVYETLILLPSSPSAVPSPPPPSPLPPPPPSPVRCAAADLALVVEGGALSVKLADTLTGGSLGEGTCLLLTSGILLLLLPVPPLGSGTRSLTGGGGVGTAAGVDEEDDEVGGVIVVVVVAAGSPC